MTNVYITVIFIHHYLYNMYNRFFIEPSTKYTLSFCLITIKLNERMVPLI